MFIEVEKQIEKLLNEELHDFTHKKVKYELTKEQRKKLKEYAKFMVSKGYSPVSIKNYLVHLRTLCFHFKKDFEDVTRKDIEKFIEDKVKDGLKPQSINTYKQMVKTFYKWFCGYWDKKEYPEMVSWIKTPIIEPKEITKNELITWEEVREILIPACETFRDKALISLLRETGARINELIDANIGDVRLENDRGFIRLKNSKKRNNVKNYREVVLIDSFYYLENLLRSHPLKSKDSPLLIGKKGKRIQYPDIFRLLEGLKIKTNWKKKLNPHHFRHSQASDMAKILSDAELRVFGGWSKNSPTISRYTHISSDDVNQKRLEMIGRAKPKEEFNMKEDLKPCPRCNELIDFNKFRFCGKCGMALNREKEIKEYTEDKTLKDKLYEKQKSKMKGEEFQKILKEMFKEEFNKFIKSEKKKVLNELEKNKN